MKKKILIILLAIFSLGVTNVSAMSKEELQDKITATYIINGAEFRLSASDIAQVERYLNQNEVSESDADYISAKIDEVVDLLEKGSAKSISDLTKEEKDQIIRILNDISEQTAIKLTISNGNIVVYNQDGTMFTTLTNLVKQTGASNLYLALSLASIISFLAVRKLNKENE